MLTNPKLSTLKMVHDIKRTMNAGVPTHTVGAAFILAIIMGLVAVSGILLKPYEARKVVADWHERILLAKEYRELSRIAYTARGLRSK